ncbi:MAG TPA: hypothetical protein VD887_10615 [Allosphingosinicella sp.]|nr:hypothetical protein [Allosphingosinicella sp.]
MDESLYVLIGTALGVLGSLGTTYLNAVLSKLKPDLVADARKKLLVSMLEDERFRWRRLERLSHVIGANEEVTKTLLLEVGARASEDGQNLWCLVSRHPFGGPQNEAESCTDV